MCSKLWSYRKVRNMSKKKELENLNRQLQEMEIRCSLLTKQLDKQDKKIELNNGIRIEPFSTGDGIYLWRENEIVSVLVDSQLERINNDSLD